MKKILQLLLLAIAIAIPTTGHAKVTYRGFVDVAPGISISDVSSSYSDDSSEGTTFGLKFNSTHGVQLNKFFVGIGAGISVSEWFFLDLYVRGRYDFFNPTKKLNPFVQLEIGTDLYGEAPFMADVAGGFRYAFSRYVGLNFGIQFDYHYVNFPDEDGSVFSPLLFVGIDF